MVVRAMPIFVSNSTQSLAVFPRDVQSLGAPEATKKEKETASQAGAKSVTKSLSVDVKM